MLQLKGKGSRSVQRLYMKSI